MRLAGRSLPSLAVYLLLGAAASAQTITEFPLPEGAQPRRIVAGADGNLWFIDSYTRIARITPTGNVSYLAIEGPTLGQPYDITSGPDGNVWFTEADDGQGAVVRVTPLGAFTRWKMPSLNIPFGISSGPDGNLWLGMTGGNNGSGAAIGRISTDGAIDVFEVPESHSRPFGSIPGGLTAGTDGNVWFIERTSIARIAPSGAIRVFANPASGVPADMTAGPEGNLWFTERGASLIGRITPEGVVTELPVSTAGENIVVGPDGALWFTQPESKIGRITTTGVASEIAIPAPASDIASGPDGSIWLTSASSPTIWRMSLDHAPAIELRVLPVVGSTPGVGGSFFRTSVQLHNGTDRPMAGRIVFHPSGVSDDGSNSGRFYYSLQPGQTQSIADLLPAMGRSGLGSADIEVTSGSVPAATIRVFNDAGEAGTMGFTEAPIRVEDALRPEQPGVLIVPADLVHLRFNVGVRTLGEGASATLTLRDAAGTIVSAASRDFLATYHKQQSASAFLGISTSPPAGGSISIEVNSGAAIFYGASVDNTTGDPSFQIARAPR